MIQQPEQLRITTGVLGCNYVQLMCHNIPYDMITHPCPNSNGDWTEPPGILGYGCVIISHNFIWINLLPNALNLMPAGLPSLVPGSTRSIHSIQHTFWNVCIQMSMLHDTRTEASDKHRETQIETMQVFLNKCSQDLWNSNSNEKCCSQYGKCCQSLD